MARTLLICRLLRYTGEIVKESKLAGFLFCALPSSQSPLLFQNRGAIFSTSAFIWQGSTQGGAKEQGQKKKKQETKEKKEKETDV